MPHPSYRRPHQLVSERLLKLLEYVGSWPCQRCGQLMLPGMDLDLGHSDGVAKAAGFPGDRLEHRRCNQRRAMAGYRAQDGTPAAQAIPAPREHSPARAG